MIRIFILVVFATLHVYGQRPFKPSSSDILDAIRKTQVLGSVLYVAAHPDDENTRLISFFANDRHYHTTYLSLTRGDGGQNLIGTEIGPLLGLIRTQELLMARGEDRGNQMFTRANDFGFSKHPNETFQIWNRDEILSDVVWAIRNTRPDIIVNRFDHRTAGNTHGHHSGSAILSYEAFALSADPGIYPSQLKWVKPWQPVRQFFNTSWFFFGSQENFEKADKSHMLALDIGSYYPLRGLSNNEIAATSRSFHKSQGFGSMGVRGGEMEYIEFIQGSPVKTDEDPFKDINTTWSRVEGGQIIGEKLNEIESKFNPIDPAASIPGLIEVYRMLEKIPDDGFWIPLKQGEIEQIIRWCAGFFIEAVADHFSVAPGENMKLLLEVINRSEAKIKLIDYQVTPSSKLYQLDTLLDFNQRYRFDAEFHIPVDHLLSNPFWLRHKPANGIYHVPDQLLRHKPEDKRPCRVSYTIEIEGLTLRGVTDVIYKQNDPVEGEMYRPLEISPAVFVNFTEETLVFASRNPKKVILRLKSSQPGVKGNLQLFLPSGWESYPEKIDFELVNRGEERSVEFSVVASEESTIDSITARVALNELEPALAYSATILEFDHIPTQTVHTPAVVKAVRLDLQKQGERIGYVMGAGDKIPDYLTQIGYHVSILSESDLTKANLAQFDALVIGIRAYNTSDRLKFYKDALMQYVYEGGNLIVQYNTTGREINTELMGPFPFTLSRERVTDENSPVVIKEREHPAIKGPNSIDATDFEGWVQERGLYFPNKWDTKYTSLLSMHDPGEGSQEGSILVAPYGKGWYVYTGLSWFRQLPAGVPGAYRLFVNLLSLGKQQEP